MHSVIVYKCILAVVRTKLGKYTNSEKKKILLIFPKFKDFVYNSRDFKTLVVLPIDKIIKPHNHDPEINLTSD